MGGWLAFSEGRRWSSWASCVRPAWQAWPAGCKKLARLRHQVRHPDEERQILAGAAALFAPETDSIPSRSSGS